MEKQIFCPLAHHEDGTWGECLKEQCGWWYTWGIETRHGACAMTQLPRPITTI